MASGFLSSEHGRNWNPRKELCPFMARMANIVHASNFSYQWVILLVLTSQTGACDCLGMERIKCVLTLTDENCGHEHGI